MDINYILNIDKKMIITFASGNNGWKILYVWFLLLFFRKSSFISVLQVFFALDKITFLVLNMMSLDV